MDNVLVEKRFKTVRFLAINLMAGLGLLIAVFYIFALRHQPSPEAATNNVVRIVAWLMSGTLFAASFLHKQFYLNKKSDKPLPEDRRLEILANSSMVSFAMIDGAVFLGLMAAIISKNPMDLVLPVLLGAIGFFKHFPNLDEWKQYIKAQRIEGI